LPVNGKGTGKTRSSTGGPMDRKTLLGKIPLFKNFDDSDLERLEQRLVGRTYPRGRILFHMGDEGGNLHIIRKGRVKVTIPSEEGEEVILAILGGGEILGEISLIDGKPRSATVEAMKDTDTLCLFREDFLEVLQGRFDVAMSVMETLAARLRRTDALLAESHFLDITNRLAKKVLDLGGTFGVQEEDGIRIAVRMTQKDLASMVGATRESVNKQLKVLRELGLLAFSDGHLKILNRNGLARRVMAVGDA